MMATIDYEKAWAYNMFIEKIEKYHYTTNNVTFHIEKETEKAVQLRIDTRDLHWVNNYDFGEYTGDKKFWYIWMPKSAISQYSEDDWELLNAKERVAF